MELHQILSARSPSSIQRDSTGKVGVGEAAVGAGTLLALERPEQLFQEIPSLRDSLAARGEYQHPVGFYKTPDLLQRGEEPRQYDRTVCPHGLWSRHIPLCDCLSHSDDTKPRLVMVPDLQKISEQFVSLVK